MSTHLARNLNLRNAPETIAVSAWIDLFFAPLVAYLEPWCISIEASPPLSLVMREKGAYMQGERASLEAHAGVVCLELFVSVSVPDSVTTQ